jgi:hypothetical protein
MQPERLQAKAVKSPGAVVTVLDDEIAEGMLPGQVAESQAVGDKARQVITMAG